MRDCKVWTRRLVRAEFRTGQRLWFCELPDSPDSSEDAPSSNESDEDDFDYGAFIDRATAHANQRNQLRQTDSSAKKNRPASPEGKGKMSEQEKVTVAMVTVANHSPRTSSEKPLVNSHLKAEGCFEHLRRSRNAHERHDCA